MFERSYIQCLKKRITEPRNFIQVVFGPRQVGKTTLVLQLTKQLPFGSFFVSADDVPAADRTWIKHVWSEARRKLANSTQNEFLLVIDEIQKIDNWSEVIKKEWDTDYRENCNLKVIIMGSSSLLIQRGLTESLAGRFETLYIPHWSYSEMFETFNWTANQYIWYGGYPGSAGLIDDEPRWRGYIKNSLIETSISKDIVMLTKVEKPVLLRRLFEIGCMYSSKIISLTKIQGDLQEKGNITTLAHYLQLLESAGLLTGLEKYAGSIIRKRSSKPKFQVFNNALINAQMNDSFENVKSDHKIWGQLVESAVGSHLLNASLIKRFNLYYWNENSYEVDFVIEKNGILIGIEVKTGKDSRNEGMSLFDKAFHPKHLFIVGTDGIPVEEFLLSDPSELFNV
jgi:predicted AAA+ superfamily ATPase